MDSIYIVAGSCYFVDSIGIQKFDLIEVAVDAEVDSEVAGHVGGLNFG